MRGSGLLLRKLTNGPLFRRSQFPDLIGCVAAVCCKLTLTWSSALGEAMRRRDFIKVIAGSATTWPFAARAQQRVNIPRVGYLFPFIQGESQQLWQACRQGIRDVG